MARKTKILVVDDAENIRRAFSGMLELSGYEAFQAETGEEAIETIEREDISLTLMDVVMPGMGGLEAAKRIRAIRKDHPVILMSGYADDRIETSGMEAGVRAFLRKPFDGSILLKTIRGEIRSAEAVEAAR
ncbi:MAG: response regulator [bacterium]|nr:response regulator [bacterium]